MKDEDKIMRYEYYIRNELIHDSNGIKKQLLIFNCLTKQLDVKAITDEEDKMKILKNYKNYKLYNNTPIFNSYSAPFKIFIDIISNCNLSCKHCLNGYKIEEHQLELNIFEKIAKYCNDFGVFNIKLGGGEPLLHPQIIDILDILSSTEVLLSMTTNGMIHNDEIFTAILKNKVNISVSLDGNQEIHNFIRGNKFAYDNAIICLDKMLSKGLKPTIKYVLNDFNNDFNNFLHVVKLGKERKIKVQLKVMKPIGDCSDKINSINSNIINKFVTLSNNLDNVFLDAEYTDYNNPKLDELTCAGKRCGAGTRFMHIVYDYIVQPCPFIRRDFYKNLKLIKTHKLNDIWLNDENFIFMRNLSIPKQCQNCNFYCKSVCYSYRYTYSKDMLGNNPICANIWTKHNLKEDKNLMKV